MIYDMLAPFYDAFNSDIDYVSWADFLEAAARKHGKGNKNELVLDLGCGTGSMTIELAKRGYDMTGIDYSVHMLDIARSRAADAGVAERILWLCQDMTSFELYGTVDVAVCCLDGINHLISKKALDKCLSLVHNYLVPDGLFIFDINGKYKFENVYSDKTYAMENEDAFCIWQNYYNVKSRICDFYITLFKDSGNGRYMRFDECQRERMYTLRAMKSALVASGFEFLGAYRDFDFNEATDEDERLYIVAKCKKDGL